jgi:peptidoglycan L-alanyl-D-glutamate endopeptidase CwlK
MKPSSEKRLQQLHPALAAAVRAIVAELAARGLVVEVVQGLRSYKEQDELYAKGRTRPGPIVTQARGGQSNHNFGLAVDLCPFTNDKPDWNAPISVWAAIGASAEAHGLEWGGTWKKFLDKPHVQLPVMTVKECASCYQAGGLDAVWSTASAKIGWVDTVREAPARARARRRVATKRRVTRVVKTRAKKTAKKTAKRTAKKTATKRRISHGRRRSRS